MKLATLTAVLFALSLCAACTKSGQNYDSAPPAGLAWAVRDATNPRRIKTQSQRIELREPAPEGVDDIARRVSRQTEATYRVLLLVRDALQLIALPQA